MYKRILQEPLLHFFVVGSILFFYLSATDTESEPKTEIVISQGKINQLTAQFTKTRNRPPSDDELEGLIKIQIREDLAFKHGVELGLVDDDTIIKRRVQQKIEFMLDSTISDLKPTQEELQNYLDSHKDKFMIEPVYSFKHIYINPEKHEDTDGYIKELSSKNLDETFQESGDRMMLESSFENISTAQIARLFGQKFSKTLDDLELNAWEGPVKSGYGIHLVFIDKKTPRHLASLDRVKDNVALEHRIEAQKKAKDAFYDELQKQYEVKVEKASK